jgi:hypothetical protein
MDGPEDAAVPTPDSPERFATLAARVPDRFPDATLDFTPASLDRLDDVVVAPPASDGADDDLAPVAALGSYLGETLVRSADAAWVETEPGHWAVVVYGDAPVTVNVFEVVRDCLRDPPALARAYETAVRETGD